MDATPSDHEVPGSSPLSSRTQWLCPVWGVEVSNEDPPLRMISIRDGTTTADFDLVPMAAEDRKRLHAIAWNLPASSLQLHRVRAAIVTNSPAIFGAEPFRQMGLTVCSLALSIWCDEISIPFCFLLHGDEGAEDGMSSTEHDPFVPPAVARARSLPPQARTQLPLLASAIAANFNVIAGAALRYYWAGHKPLLLDATLDYAIAAESLLCRGISSQVSATFCRRAGKLLAPDVADRPALEHRARQLYALRSKIAHGDDAGLQTALAPWQGDHMRARNAARAFTRDILVAMLADPSLFTTAGLQRLD